MVEIQNQNRQRCSFDWNWKFRHGDDLAAIHSGFDDSAWRSLHLPHDWSIEGTYDKMNPSGARGGFLPTGIGWYRKSFECREPLEGKRIFLEFDGIYMNAQVWLNGHTVNESHPNGYIGFEIELTHYLINGMNTIAVRVDNSLCPNARWYTGSGIYRHVWLTVTNTVYVPHWGTYVTTPEIYPDRGVVRVLTDIRNSDVQAHTIELASEVFAGGTLSVGKSLSNHTILPNATITVEHMIDVIHPILWSPETPSMYEMKSEIREAGKTIDDYETPFGIRAFQFDSINGFSLNGVPMKFKGVCLHHDAGPVGSAVPDKLLRKRLLMLKEMGCNAVRTAHHPMAPEFYDLCDRIGLMVMNEAFDGWEQTKASFDYGLYFERYWQWDLDDMIRRDRNHSCIIMWSIGNEVTDIRPDMTRQLVDFVHLTDPTRPVTCGIQSVGPIFEANRALLDIAGYNDGGGACFTYESDHALHPDRVMVATEAPHTFQTRGFYRTQTWWRDKNQPRIEIPNLTEEELFFDGSLMYNSSYDNSGVRSSARHSWGFVLKYPYLTGEFRWTGFDYLGESFGWPARSANFGVIDLANFKKDHFYFYQSRYTEGPMIHLLPYWTHPGMEGTVIPVWVYTNCEEVELILNGRSFGCKKMTEDMYLSWDIHYEPGTLIAVGYRNGEKMVVRSIETAHEPTVIRLSVDNANLLPDGRDVAQVSFEITDRNGNLVPSAENEVQLLHFGPAVLLGTENGDPLDQTPAKSALRKAFYGLGMGLYQSTFEVGDIEVLAAGILGQRIFSEKTTVTVDIDRVVLRGSLQPRKLQAFYTMDADREESDYKKYAGSFDIVSDCTIRALIKENGQTILKLSSHFHKGCKEKVIDRTHGNKPFEMSERYPGPVASELYGLWTDGSCLYNFTPEGEVYRRIGNDEPMPVGVWWYEFPTDPFESPNYFGTGEMIWENERKVSLALKTQEAHELILQFTDRTLILTKVNRPITLK